MSVKRPEQQLSVASRTIFLYAVVFVVAILFLLGMVAVIFSNDAEESSVLIARHPSVEAVAQFTSHMNPHIILVHNIAGSATVRTWFRHEDGIGTLRSNAQDEIAVFFDRHSTGSLHMVVNESLNEYFVRAGDAVDLKPRERDDETRGMTWYIHALGSSAPVTLYSGNGYIHVSRRVYFDSTVDSPDFLGVVSVAVPFNELLDIMRHSFHKWDARGYIINNQGNVVLDSEYGGIPSPAPPSIFDSYGYSDMLEGVISRMGGHVFPPGITPEVFSINVDNYRFGSIAPIAGTDWMVVVVSGQGHLFSLAQFWPLILGGIFVTLMIIIVSYLITRTAILVPLQKLAESTTNATTEGMNSQIYGLERNDEIGKLAHSVQGLHLSLGDSNAALIELMQEREHQEVLMGTIDEVTFALLGMSDDVLEQFNSSLSKGVQTVSICANVEAIYVYQNVKIGDEQGYVTRFQLEGGAPVPLDDEASWHSYSATPGWFDKLEAGEIINVHVSELTETERARVSAKATAVLVVPVKFQERFWGTVWYEDVRYNTRFDANRVGLLKSASIMIVSAVHRRSHVTLIREATDRQRLMLDAMPLSCFIWDRSLKMIDANTMAIQLFGFSSREELFVRFNESFPEYQSSGRLSRELFYEHIQKAFDEETFEFEWMHRMPETMEVIPVEVTMQRMYFRGDYVVAGYVSDVREHRHMRAEIEHRGHLLYTVNSVANVLLQANIDEFEPALFRSLSMMARAVDVERVFVWEYKQRGGQRYFNQIYEWVGDATIFGRQNHEITYTDDTIVGMESQLLRGLCFTGATKDLPKDVCTSLMLDDCKSYLMTPILLHNKLWGVVGYGDLQNERGFSESDESILRSGGVLVTSALLRYEMTQDIKATATKLQAVISNYSGIIWSVDADDVITLFNGLALQRLGIQPSFYEGKRLEEIPENWYDFGIESNVKKTYTEGPQRWTIHIREDVFAARTSPVYDAYGNITDIVGSIDDVTDSVRLQEQLELAVFEAQSASQAKSNFLSTMSHEMRTPMNAITGMCNIGKDADDIDRKDYAFEKIEAASNHLLGVISDVLDMSKIEAGMLALSDEAFDLNRIIDRVVAVIHFRIDEKNQKFEMNVSPDVPNVLVADDQRLMQVLTNLLSNAVKFTPDNKEIRLEVNLLSKDEKSCVLKFDVIDQGIGLSAEQQGILFQSFVQAEASTTRKYGGTGLGLAISKHIVELMGGAIWIESELDKGAKFSFTIQAKLPGESQLPASQEEINWGTEEMKYPGMTLLLAEDVEINREIVQAMLSESEINIECAENGVEALAMFAENPDRYDLIFMDVHMPLMDGYEATRSIRALGAPRAKKVPIVAMTANVFREDIEKCLAAGMDAHVGKPLDFDNVRDVLKRFLLMGRSSR